jgi:hypothetical protein
MFSRSPMSRRPSAASALLALVLSSACAAAIQDVHLTSEVPAEFWFPDAARYYLQAQGFEVSVLENNDAHIRVSAARELVDVRSEVYVTMKTQHAVGLRDTSSPLDPFKAEIRVLRYLRDPDGGWAAADPEPLRGLAEELAQVIKTGSRG